MHQRLSLVLLLTAVLVVDSVGGQPQTGVGPSSLGDGGSASGDFYAIAPCTAEPPGDAAAPPGAEGLAVCTYQRRAYISAWEAIGSPLAYNETNLKAERWFVHTPHAAWPLEVLAFAAHLVALRAFVDQVEPQNAAILVYGASLELVDNVLRNLPAAVMQARLLEAPPRAWDAITNCSIVQNGSVGCYSCISRQGALRLLGRYPVAALSVDMASGQRHQQRPPAAAATSASPDLLKPRACNIPWHAHVEELLRRGMLLPYSPRMAGSSVGGGGEGSEGPAETAARSRGVRLAPLDWLGWPGTSGGSLQHTPTARAAATLPTRGRRHLVFTTAGDQAVWQSWRGDASCEQTFDLIVAYYGQHGPLSSPEFGGADYLYSARGYKWQNVHRLHALYPTLLAAYDAVAVWDDDLATNCSEINAMLQTVTDKQLWVAQPSLTSSSKVSHRITKNDPALQLVYSNFVETNAPIFQAAKLVQILNDQRYPPEMLGWGSDLMYMYLLGLDRKEQYAIMHTHTVYNPPDQAKAGGREVEKLGNDHFMIRLYKSWAERWGFEGLYAHIVHACIPRDPKKHETLPPYCPKPERQGKGEG